MELATTDRIRLTYGLIRRRQLAVAGAALLALPVVLQDYSLSTNIVILSIFAMGYNVALGETGMLTFGHAAFFGLGAYGSGMYLVHLDAPAWLGFVCLLTGTALAAVGGVVIGALSLRRRGTYLALITLAFAQMLYFVAFQLEGLTGGDDGLLGVPTPELGVPGVFVLSFSRGVGPISGSLLFYLLVVSLFLLTWVGLRRTKRSNFGRTLNAIRENENRARFLGFDVDRYRLAAFVLSAAVSGFAGSLYAIYLNYVGLGTLHWILSGEVNFWVLLGGIGSFIGAAVGTLVYYVVSDTLNSVTSHWQLPMGLILIVIVLFFPEGITGTVREWVERNVDDDPSEGDARSALEASGRGEEVE